MSHGVPTSLHFVPNLYLEILVQLSQDPFMKQVQYGGQLSIVIARLQSSTGGANTDQSERLKERLIAQLSHSDGIRGFFVSYLTMEPDDDDDADAHEGNPNQEDMSVPKCLQEAMAIVDPQELVPLACT